MRRREVITLLGGSAVFWPLAAHTQQPARPVIGFLHSASPGPYAAYVASFQKGLNEAGYVDGQNVTVEYRWAEGRFDRLSELAAELVGRRVDAIATPGNTSAAVAAKAATATIPIIFGVSDDPVKFGLVASLSHPGGNATGINFLTSELVEKRFGLLRELVPNATRVSVLVNPANTANAETTIKQVKAAGRSLGMQIHVVNATSSGEIDAAFTILERDRPDALFVSPDAVFNGLRVQLAILAMRNRIPSVFSVREYVEAGGLMSYGTDIADMFRQVGVYTGRILKGEKPADLPVIQPTKLELAINLNTAKALGINVPPMLLARADKVIE
jgi:putative ABC transport system substrate-binding protein